MKYLDLFFGPTNQRLSQSSATFTASLYSVTFELQSAADRAVADLTSSPETQKLKAEVARESRRPEQRDESSLGAYLLTATLGKTIASTSAVITSSGQLQQPQQDELQPIDDDWIIIDKLPKKQNRSLVERKSQQILQMALNQTDVELIRASWNVVRKDPVSSGVLLFKGLFTKFPQYMEMFPQFTELDLEHMQDNKRLLKHAVKVIETVGFVVDSIGDPSKSSKLEAALIELVKGHLKRKVGLVEFRNLGIVLIDFICDINQRRVGQCKLNKSSTSDSSNHSSNDDSETMTSALDKIRASSSPSSSSEEEAAANYLPDVASHLPDSETALASATVAADGQPFSRSQEPKLDTNLLVAAWTKLYSSILDLVKREEAREPDQRAD